MKEDILEQLVEDWFVSKTGWFVKHNLKFRPHKEHKEYSSKKDSVHSDIDILAYSPLEKGCKRVVVVTCKSWQSGLDVKRWKDVIESGILNQTDTEWKYFRELISDKWMHSFVTKIFEETKQRDFTYMIAVTKIKGSLADIENLESSIIVKDHFRKHNSKIEIKVMTLKGILDEITTRIKSKETTVLESTDVGRFLQLAKAAKIDIGGMI